MKYFIKNKNKGFTLVETLVAIAILMISIVGPLTIAQKSLNSSIYARDQVVASFLAQKVIEKVKNERLNVEQTSRDIYGDPCDGSCIAGFPKYTIDVSATDGAGTAGLSRTYEYALKVTVYWNTGTIRNSFTLENHMFDTVL